MSSFYSQLVSLTSIIIWIEGGFFWEEKGVDITRYKFESPDDGQQTANGLSLI